MAGSTLAPTTAIFTASASKSRIGLWRVQAPEARAGYCIATLLSILCLTSSLVAQQPPRRPSADWAGLNRYGSENTEIPPPKPGEDRVVFLGDQITEKWGRGNTPFFPSKPYFNRGIGGQTSAQMLVRFRQDVIKLKPKAVVIMAGANDMTGLFGPGTEGTISENFMSMVELAKTNGIR